jgi:hypothetical protein
MAEAMRIMPETAVFCILVVIAGCSSACDKRLFRSPTFKGAAEVRRHLSANEVEFTRFAEKWAADFPNGQTFCYFDEGEYRWGRFYIDRDKPGFKVGTGSRNGRSVPTFADAVQRAGTTESDLASWIRRAQALKVYCVESSSYSGSVEIMLEGSEWLPYGFRYAPTGKPKAYEELAFYSKLNGAPGDVGLRPLYGRWFYFEGKR